MENKQTSKKKNGNSKPRPLWQMQQAEKKSANDTNKQKQDQFVNQQSDALQKAHWQQQIRNISQLSVESETEELERDPYTTQNDILQLKDLENISNSHHNSDIDMPVQVLQQQIVINKIQFNGSKNTVQKASIQKSNPDKQLLINSPVKYQSQKTSPYKKQEIKTVESEEGKMVRIAKKNNQKSNQKNQIFDYNSKNSSQLIENENKQNPDSNAQINENDQNPLKISLASSQPPEPLEQSNVPKPEQFSNVDWILNNQPKKNNQIYQQAQNKSLDYQNCNYSLNLFGDFIFKDQEIQQQKELNQYQRLNNKSTSQLNQSQAKESVLNQRMNISKSVIKNQWLKDLTRQLSNDYLEGQFCDRKSDLNQQVFIESPEKSSQSAAVKQNLFSVQSHNNLNKSHQSQTKDKKRYSEVNNDKLRKIEQEIQATKMSLFARSQNANNSTYEYQKFEGQYENLDEINVLQPSSVTPLRQNNSPYSHQQQQNSKLSQFDQKQNPSSLNQKSVEKLHQFDMLDDYYMRQIQINNDLNLTNVSSQSVEANADYKQPLSHYGVQLGEKLPFVNNLLGQDIKPEQQEIYKANQFNQAVFNSCGSQKKLRNTASPNNGQIDQNSIPTNQKGKSNYDHGKISRNHQKEFKELSELSILKPQKCESSDYSPQIISMYNDYNYIEDEQKKQLQKQQEEKLLDEIMEKAMKKLNEEYKRETISNKIQDYVQDSLQQSKSAHVYDENYSDQQKYIQSENEYQIIEKMFKKHTEGIGIDTIEESDANFEQTQQLRKSLDEQINSYQSMITQEQFKFQNLFKAEDVDEDNTEPKVSTDQENLINLERESQIMKFDSKKQIINNKSLTNDWIDNQIKRNNVFTKPNQNDFSEQPTKYNYESQLNQKEQKKQDFSLLNIKQNKKVDKINFNQLNLQQNINIRDLNIHSNNLRNQRSLFANQNKQQYSSARGTQQSQIQKQKLYQSTISNNKIQNNVRNKDKKVKTLEKEQSLIQKSKSMACIENQSLIYELNVKSNFNNDRSDQDFEPQNLESYQSLANFNHLMNLQTKTCFEDNKSSGSCTNQEKKLKMSDVQKLYQNRVDFFKDFYKSVKSYKNFNHDLQFKEFIERKEEEEKKRKAQKEKQLANERHSTIDASISARQDTSQQSQRIHKIGYMQNLSTHQFETERNLIKSSNLITSRISNISSKNYQSDFSKRQQSGSGAISQKATLKKQNFKSLNQNSKESLTKLVNVKKYQDFKLQNRNLKLQQPKVKSVDKKGEPKLMSKQFSIESLKKPDKLDKINEKLTHKRIKSNPFINNNKQMNRHKLSPFVIQPLPKSNVLNQDLQFELDKALQCFNKDDQPQQQIQKVLQELKMVDDSSLNNYQNLFQKQVEKEGVIDYQLLKLQLTKLLNFDCGKAKSAVKLQDFEKHFILIRKENLKNKNKIQNSNLIQKVYDRAYHQFNIPKQIGIKSQIEKKLNNYNPILNQKRSNLDYNEPKKQRNVFKKPVQFNKVTNIKDQYETQKNKYFQLANQIKKNPNQLLQQNLFNQQYYKETTENKNQLINHKLMQKKDQPEQHNHQKFNNIQNSQLRQIHNNNFKQNQIDQQQSIFQNQSLDIITNTLKYENVVHNQEQPSKDSNQEKSELLFIQNEILQVKTNNYSPINMRNETMEKEFSQNHNNRISSERRSRLSPREKPCSSSRRSYRVNKQNFKNSSPQINNESPLSERNIINVNNSIEKLSQCQQILENKLQDIQNQIASGNLNNHFGENDKQDYFNNLEHQIEVQNSAEEQNYFQRQQQQNNTQSYLLNQPEQQQIVQKDTQNDQSYNKAYQRNDEAQEGDQPILILDIKILKDNPKKIIIYEYDDPDQIVDQFCLENNIDEQKKRKLISVIKQQIQEYYTDQKQDQTSQEENAISQYSQNNLQEIDSQLSSNYSPNPTKKLSNTQVTEEYQQTDIDDYQSEVTLENNYLKMPQRNSLTQIDEHENEEQTIDF